MAANGAPKVVVEALRETTAAAVLALRCRFALGMVGAGDDAAFEDKAAIADRFSNVRTSTPLATISFVTPAVVR